MNNAPYRNTSSDHAQRGAIFSIRNILFLCAWLLIWQGYHGFGTIVELSFLTIPGLFLEQSFLVFTLFLLLVERVISGDYTFSRSFFSGPILLMGFALVLSWMHGMLIRQQFTLVYEAHESIQIVITFFLVLNIFRKPEERKILMVFLLSTMIIKSGESTWKRFFSEDPEKGWGTLLMWRDGYLMCMGVVSVIIFAHYRGRTFRRLKIIFYASFPLLLYGLLVSFRRTFIIGMVVAAITLFVTVGKGRRKKHLVLFIGFFMLIILFVLISDPLTIIARIAGVIQPTEEGSTYIRLMELPNVLENIRHNPIFGVPIGVEWHQYYRMPLLANFTTLGTHNTYLYWPLRTGIIGTFAFFWLLARIWKVLIINTALQKTEEDFLMNQILIQSIVVYQFGCFFGLMYADAMSITTGFILVLLQLQLTHSSGLISYRKVNLWKTWREKQIVYRTAQPLMKPAAS